MKWREVLKVYNSSGKPFKYNTLALYLEYLTICRRKEASNLQLASTYGWSSVGSGLGRKVPTENRTELPYPKPKPAEIY